LKTSIARAYGKSRTSRNAYRPRGHEARPVRLRERPVREPPAAHNFEIADCSNRINLEFALDSELDVENSLHKVDTLTAALAEFRTGLVEEARLYRERQPDVERLNRDVPQSRPRRRRRSRRR
jgi:hypothetical protein